MYIIIFYDREYYDLEMMKHNYQSLHCLVCIYIRLYRCTCNYKPPELARALVRAGDYKRNRIAYNIIIYIIHVDKLKLYSIIFRSSRHYNYYIV